MTVLLPCCVIDGWWWVTSFLLVVSVFSDGPDDDVCVGFIVSCQIFATVSFTNNTHVRTSAAKTTKNVDGRTLTVMLMMMMCDVCDGKTKSWLIGT